MNNVGGNLPIVITPISKVMGYRETLILFYPGFYLLSMYTIIAQHNINDHIYLINNKGSIVFGFLGLALRSSSAKLNLKEEQEFSPVIDKPGQEFSSKQLEDTQDSVSSSSDAKNDDESAPTKDSLS